MKVVIMTTQSQMQETTTTIRVTFDTRNRLAKLGSKDDSFDDILKKLLDQNEKIKSLAS